MAKNPVKIIAYVATTTLISNALYCIVIKRYFLQCFKHLRLDLVTMLRRVAAQNSLVCV